MRSIPIDATPRPHSLFVRHARGTLLLAVAWGTGAVGGACDGPHGGTGNTGPLGIEGATCARSADCQAPLQCIDEECSTVDAESDATDARASSDASDTSATSTPEVTGTSSLTGVWTRAACETGPNPNCLDRSIDGLPDSAEFGWCGYEGYTCNACPHGFRDVQGSYRLMMADETGLPNPTLPDPATDIAERLLIDGNTFDDEIHDIRGGRDTHVRGWFFCADSAEDPRQRIFWVPQAPSTQPVYDSGLIEAGLNDAISIAYLEGQTTFTATYCRIGTPYRGLPCNDSIAR